MLFISIFVLLTASIGTYVLHHAETRLRTLQQSGISNTLHQALRSTLSFQRILFTTKSSQAIAVKHTLRSTLHIVEQMTRNSENPIQLLRTFSLPSELMVSVVDEKLNTVYQSPQLPNAIDNLTDIKGRHVALHALESTQNNSRPFFLVKTQKNSLPMHLYGEHFYLPKAKLFVGLWKNVTHIQEIYNNIYADNLETLNNSFKQIVLGETGFIFVLDNKGNYVIGSDHVKKNLGASLTLQGAQLMQKLTKSQHVQTFIVNDTEILDAKYVDNENPKPLHIFALYVKPKNWYVMGIIYEDAFQAPVNALFRSFMMALCAVMLCILPIAVFVLTRMTAPLSILSHHARTLPDQDFTEESNADASLERLAQHCRSVEIRELAQSFVFMDNSLRERVRELMRITSKRERVEGELAAAIEVQKSILPQDSPVHELKGRVELGFSLIPAHEMGGDLYDFFPLDEDRLCFVIGDVAGKGMPAALFMSITVTLIRSHARSDIQLTELVSIVNNNLAYENNACMFVTVCLGILDMNTGDISYVNAGHNWPIILRNSSESAPKLQTLDELSGPVMGAMTDIDYSTLSTRLQPGDTLFLYTDGVTEAMNADSCEYGTEALEATLMAQAQSDATALIQHVLKDVEKHVDGEKASDDITMLTIQFKPNKS